MGREHTPKTNLKGELKRREEQGVREAYCDTCERFTPLMEEPLRQDELNPFLGGSVFCGKCYAIHTSVHLNQGNTYETPTVKRQRLCVQIYRDGGH